MIEFAVPNGQYDNSYESRLQQSYQEYWACEQSIASARASVMVYDDVNKKWVPSGTSSGLSKVHIFQHQINNTFRVVGRKLQDHEVVINCAILKGLKYNQATATFHQWRDNKQVYGLNFSGKEDADAFAKAMFHALDVLCNGVRSQVPMAPPSQATYQPTNGQYDEDMGYSPMVSLPRVAVYHQVTPGGPSRTSPRTPTSPNGAPSFVDRSMTREDAAIIQERRLSQQQQILGSPGNSSPGVPQPPPAPGHHRTSSAPPAPQPPPMALAPTASPMGGPPMAPPAPPAPPCPPWNGQSAGPPLPPSGGGGPPPPPPPPPDMSMAGDQDMPPSLASQIQSAKLKRNKQSAENSGSSTSSGGSSNYGTIGRSGGMGSMTSMMDEMAKTLARRRKAVEKKEPVEEVEVGLKSSDSKSCTNGKFNGGESPKMSRKRFGSASEEQLPKVNGLNDSMSAIPSADLEALKQDILKEMRKEMGKMKQDIIDAIKVELNRR